MQYKAYNQKHVRKPISEFTIILTILLILLGLASINIIAYTAAYLENVSLAKAAAQAASVHSKRTHALEAAIKVFEDTPRSSLLKNEIGIKNETLDFSFDEPGRQGTVKVTSRLTFCPPIRVPFLPNCEAETLCASVQETINPKVELIQNDHKDSFIALSQHEPTVSKNLSQLASPELDAQDLETTPAIPTSAHASVKSHIVQHPMMQQHMIQQNLLQQSFVQQQYPSQTSKYHFATFRTQTTKGENPS